MKALGENIATELAGCGVKVRFPQGRFYLFLDLSHFKERLSNRGIENSREMCRSEFFDFFA
jgi:hypothetical protein